MATPTNRPSKIHPAARVVMRLPETDPAKDPWTGAPITLGRNFEDPTLVNEDTPLAPTEGKSSAELLQELEGPRDDLAPPPAVEEPPRAQFRLSELMILMTLAAVGLAGARALPADMFAFVAGVLAFAALWLVAQWEIRNRWALLAVWGLATVYLFAAAVALVLGT